MNGGSGVSIGGGDGFLGCQKPWIFVVWLPESWIFFSLEGDGPFSCLSPSHTISVFFKCNMFHIFLLIFIFFQPSQKQNQRNLIYLRMLPWESRYVIRKELPLHSYSLRSQYDILKEARDTNHLVDVSRRLYIASSERRATDSADSCAQGSAFIRHIFMFYSTTVAKAIKSSSSFID